MALNISGSGSMGVQSLTGTMIKHAPHIHHKDCGCKYLTKTFFHDHKGVPKRPWDTKTSLWPFKYIGNQTSDPLWPVRETQPPKHRTTNPTKGALKKPLEKVTKAVGFADTDVVIEAPLPAVLPAKHRTLRPIKGALKVNSATPKKVVAFTDAAYCMETGQPVPPTENNHQAQRRFRFANKALRATKVLADPIQEDEPLRSREPTKREAIRFRNHDLEVEWNLDVAKRTRFRENWEAIERGALDFIVFIHSQESAAMKRIQELVRLSVRENCLVGSYTGDEMAFAKRAVEPAFIHPGRYKNPKTAMSFPQDSPAENGTGMGDESDISSVYD
ncbi:hypothetical protein BGZ61DRAFT_584371 [Ilyonectria robusta]|uniref:uncharacterized protein n=1 Tax=Ilyonectria robusta TaxID=1079257 RepID=UPI001E8CA564|nr:uncharacterized protein BGZ61DRAFT_584371 [Ilyonectria robusta]KAH8734350.1 hypothetical protein BGZ61DRAFT_584371 [Ilyonectria robusta]